MRILIVEDDVVTALDAELALMGAGHVVVGTAAREEEAVRMALRERPDVMVLDMQLADGGSGPRVAERVRAVLDVPVVFASGSLGPAERRSLAALEPVAMIDKPYHDAQLLGAVAQAA